MKQTSTAERSRPGRGMSCAAAALAPWVLVAASCGRAPSESEPSSPQVETTDPSADLRTGVPALLYVAASNQRRASAGIVEADSLRAGIYVHASRRFVPILPSIDGATSALVDPVRERALVISLLIDDCRADFCPHVRKVAIEAHDLSPAARPPIRAEQAVEGPFYQLYAQPTRDGARLLLGDCRYASCSSGWLRLTGGALAPDAEQRTLAGFLLDVRYRGTLVTYVEPGYAVRGGSLERETARPIALPALHAHADHHSVLVEPNRRMALVVSVRDGCDCDQHELSVLNHSISRVELGSGRVELLFHGSGAATALLDRSGAAYVQSEATVKRWRSIAEIRNGVPDTLPADVLLSPPRREDQNCCGL